MKLPIVLVVISVFIFYIIVPILIWIFARNSRVGKLLTITFGVLFAIILFFGITSKIYFVDSYAFVTIDFSANWCDKLINFGLGNLDKVDLLINIVMLIPIGLLVVYFNKKSLINKMLVLVGVGLFSGVVLETLQFVLPVYRSVQLSDALLNVLSVVLGGLIGLLYDSVLIYKIRKK